MDGGGGGGVKDYISILAGQTGMYACSKMHSSPAKEATKI